MYQINSKYFRAFFALLVVSCSVSVIAQNASSVLPPDPSALMHLARSRNGLTGSDVKPWHIRGTYRFFDVKGKPEYEGTYEEWWASATSYKLSFNSPRSRQTDYAIGTGLLREGSQEWQSGMELLMRTSLIQPLPDVSQLNGFTLQRRTQPVGHSAIECVDIKSAPSPNPNVAGEFSPAACFEQAQPVLRMYSERESTRIVYNQVVLFQGHYLARQIQVFSAGKLVGDMNLNIVETLKDPPDLVMTPPSTALPVDLTNIRFEEGTRWTTLLKETVPLYPREAKYAGVEGTINFKATIGVDGHVESMQIIDGPLKLRQAAFDAASQWVYRPFDLLGQPRRVEVKTKVIFNLR